MRAVLLYTDVRLVNHQQTQALAGCGVDAGWLVALGTCMHSHVACCMVEGLALWMTCFEVHLKAFGYWQVCTHGGVFLDPGSGCSGWYLAQSPTWDPLILPNAHSRIVAVKHLW